MRLFVKRLLEMGSAGGREARQDPLDFPVSVSVVGKTRGWTSLEEWVSRGLGAVAGRLVAEDSAR
jgi:hypothetical protein